ncbi:hypothetical protein [Sphingomonas fennica]|uniref:Uncharacterized protein n=1 Tax=Edaphosphingomonas fennica TaxID=114404 RepID=A0A2T4HW12_9SPHN|nr:hypothetical protein [Sphingomonas fennica]PTD19999.1 hypothetical protein CV103_12555 [Sphingomonas fennica]
MRGADIIYPAEMIQKALSVRDVIRAAFKAGGIGAAIGTALFTGYFVITGSGALLLIAPLVFLIGAAVTVMWSILITLPSLWIARNVEPRYPVATALIVAVFLYAAGHFFFTNLFFGPADGGFAGKGIVPMFGLPTAIALPFALSWARQTA